jgi:hypothetical protein
MAEQGRRMISSNFLTANGFNKGDDWSSFIPDKPLTIVKLSLESESGPRST